MGRLWGWDVKGKIKGEVIYLTSAHCHLNDMMESEYHDLVIFAVLRGMTSTAA